MTIAEFAIARHVAILMEEAKTRQLTPREERFLTKHQTEVMVRNALIEKEKEE